MKYPSSFSFYRRFTRAQRLLSSFLIAVLLTLTGFFFWPTPQVHATVVNYTAGTTNWVAPAGVYTVSVELWGGGGTGGSATGNSGARGGGGAGGQYAIKQVSVTPGNSYSIVVGGTSTASTNGVVNGNDSTFASTTVVAKGGAGGATSSGTSSSGGTGATTSGVGDTVYAGGSGGNGTVGGNSGGGGSGAGSTGTGNSGTAGVAGTAKSANGGAGGTGVSTDSAVNPGNNYGGGGSGGLATGSPNRAGGDGAAGYSQLTYTAVTTTLADTTDPSNATLAPGASATMAGAFTFQASAAGNYPVSAVVVGLGTGAATGISLVEITDSAGSTVYGSTSNPGSDTPTVTLSTNTLNVTSSLVTYKIRVTPKTHANMAAPNGATYTVTAKINSWTDSNAQAGTDTAGTTLTIDNASPSAATSTSATPGNAQNTLNWTTSASSDFSRSVVLRWTSASAGSEVPAEGATYSVGDTITTATVVCVRTSDAASTAVSGTDGGGGNCSATALTNGTAYSYKVFQKDSNANFDTGVSTSMTNIIPTLTTLADTTDPSNATLAPSASATMAGAFTFQTSDSTDVITAVVVGLGSGAATGISLVEITDSAGSTVYGSTSNPGSDTPTVTLSTNTLTATTSLTTYKIRITPKTHANMAAPNGATYTVTAKINSWTGTKPQTGSDTAGTTLTIDNASPSAATSTSGTVGNTQNTLNWTTSASSDISRSLVLRWTASSAGSEVPVEGTDYSVGNTITTATVVCVRTGESASTAVSGTDGGGGNCSGTALTNGTAYSYRIFQKDSNGNYDTGVAVNNLIPNVLTLSDGTDPSNATLAPGASATMAGAFQLQMAASTDIVSSVVVGLGTGAATGISLVEITDSAGSTVYGSTSNPGSDTPTVTLSTNTLTATTSLTTYKIRITPKTHANMAAPNGATYTVTAKINSLTTATFSSTGSDTAGTTLTLDNLSPSSVTATSGSPGSSQVTLSWTTSASADISRSVILRWTASSAGSEVPVEGTDYSVGNTITTATVVCVRTGESASASVSDTDGGGGNCSASALSNGTAYSYKIFQKDSNGNYDTGVAVDNQTPTSPGVGQSATFKKTVKFYGAVKIK